MVHNDNRDGLVGKDSLDGVEITHRHDADLDVLASVDVVHEGLHGVDVGGDGGEGRALIGAGGAGNIEGLDTDSVVVGTTNDVVEFADISNTSSDGIESLVGGGEEESVGIERTVLGTELVHDGLEVVGPETDGGSDGVVTSGKILVDVAADGDVSGLEDGLESAGGGGGGREGNGVGVGGTGETSA